MFEIRVSIRILFKSVNALVRSSALLPIASSIRSPPRGPLSFREFTPQTRFFEPQILAAVTVLLHQKKRQLFNVSFRAYTSRALLISSNYKVPLHSTVPAIICIKFVSLMVRKSRRLIFCQQCRVHLLGHPDCHVDAQII